MDVYDVLNYMNAIYSGIIIVTGTLSNLACIVICLRPTLRKIPTFVFYSFLLFSDILTLYVWNVDHMLIVFAQTQLEFMGINVCKSVTFIQLFGMQNSAWTLVLMTYERYLSTRIIKWRTHYFNSFRALIVCLITTGLLIVMNSSFAITLEYVNIYKINDSVECFGEEIYYYWMQEHIFMYSVIPAGLVFAFNILLIYQIQRTKKIKQVKTDKEQKNQSKANLSIMMTATLFTILTFPNSIANGYYSAHLLSTKPGTTLLFFLDTVAFSFHAWNFVGLYLTNKSFKRELDGVLKFSKIGLSRTRIRPTVGT